MATALFTTRRPLASLLSHAISSRRHRLSLPLINSASAATYPPHQTNSIIIPTRFKTSGSGYSPLNDPSPNWSNRPPKETILLDGCDYEHWLIVMEFNSDPKPTEEEMINAYVKTLASVVGSEEEAKKKIYSVCTTTYTGFGALISEELSYKVKGLPGVLWVLPDSYLDVPNKDYGGDLFVDGKVIHRPQYRFNERQNTRNRPRPRYDRRRETMQVERREQSLAVNQHKPTSTVEQNTSQGVGGGYPPNHGGFQGNNA
ncbi:multiple organellar RNA editing factor 3, mitochondrial-like [Olea europaea var. sylvestris]|uniref:multiple organellar RNA editing factor 3, mitochondrial-like n=1 Tax=Olea europaea var. sylvestris TaxID=158386 RepID=UPI000C1CD952|nr:multiple organellar RNA editing factor 3, mitochondrial-like [Olea europaea var. sylvestris]